MGMADNRFNPASPATRAQAAALLHRLVKCSIDPAMAQGWEQNDSGKYFYYYNGAPITGRQEINGIAYVFTQNGELYNGWMSDNAGNRMFIHGNKPLTGWWDIGSTGDMKRYHFDENGRLLPA